MVACMRTNDTLIRLITIPLRTILYMLPVATPPNAIVFGSGHVPMYKMVRSGIVINLIGVVIVTATFYLIARPILGIEVDSLPLWVQQ